MKRQTRQSDRGFTLLELILVMVIMLIMLGIAAPSLRGVVRSTRLDTQARQLLTMLQQAQQRATTQAVAHRMVIDPLERKYWIEKQDGAVFEQIQASWAGPFVLDDMFEIESRDLPEEATYWVVPFYPNGLTEPGALQLTNERGEGMVIRCEAAAERFVIIEQDAEWGADVLDQR